jgi:hypothetical protein
MQARTFARRSPQRRGRAGITYPLATAEVEVAPWRWVPWPLLLWSWFGVWFRRVGLGLALLRSLLPAATDLLCDGNLACCLARMQARTFARRILQQRGRAGCCGTGNPGNKDFGQGVPKIQVPEIRVVRISADFGERCISLCADSGERPPKENSFGATGGGDRLRITPGSVTSTLASG